MLLFWNNLSDNATLTASTADSYWPVSNLQNDQKVRVWKTLGTQATESVVFDLGSAQAVTSFIAHYHNFDGTETAVSIQGNSANSWGSPAFSQTVAYTATTMAATFASQSYRYWRFVFTKPSSGAIRSIGRVFLGTYYDTGSQGDPDFDGLQAAVNDASVATDNLYGQTYTEKRGQFYTFQIDQTFLPESIQAQLRTIVAAVGNWKTFFIQIRSTAPFNNYFYVLLADSQPLPSKVDGMDTDLTWSNTLKLKEQL
jgi:hypothetical protein